MAINHNDNTILGTNSIGQGCVNAVRGWQSAALRAASAFEACGLYFSRGWYALVLKRMTPAMTPISATCRTSDRRRQRHQRWMSGVVVDPGTVGVC